MQGSKTKEVKVGFENLIGLEYECQKCGCVIKTDFSRPGMVRYCPNCESGFSCDDMEDPIIHLKRALEAYKKVDGVKIRLVCEEVEE